VRFFSFHYQPDNWRAPQVRNIGVVEGNQPVRDNDWETILGLNEYRMQEEVNRIYEAAKR
jgi:hypothetical protein